MAGAGDGSKDLKGSSSSKNKIADAGDGSKDLKGSSSSKNKNTVPYGSNVLKRKSEVMGSSPSKKLATSKDFSRKTMKISAVTRAQLKIPFEDIDRVVYCVVTTNTHSAGFCVGHALFDMVGHRNFTVADHYVKDTVLVAFEDPFDVLLVAGNNIRRGPEALMSVRRVSRIEQYVPDWDGYFQRNIIIAAGPEEDENVDDEVDELAIFNSDYYCSGGGFSGGSGGGGSAGGGAAASVPAA